MGGSIHCSPTRSHSHLIEGSFGEKGRADYTVIVHEDGPVQLSAIVSHDPAAKKYDSNSFYISFDDDPKHTWHAHRIWNQMQELSIDKTFDLTSGRHTLHVGVREANTRMQSLRIVQGQASFIGAHGVLVPVCLCVCVCVCVYAF